MESLESARVRKYLRLVDASFSFGGGWFTCGLGGSVGMLPFYV